MAKRPNILMIMTDQHHAGCFGYRGHPDVRTPHIDQLAAEGVRCDDCFAQNGVCVPSRVSYLTGQYCHTHGVYGDDQDGVPNDALSLAKYLQPFGYDTALIGKKHLPNWTTHGFQHERLCYHADAPVRMLHYYNYLKKHNLHHLYDDLGNVERFCLPEGPTVPVAHSLEVWTGNEAVDYLNQRESDRPFFLQVSFERPHPPLTVPDGCPYTYDPDALTLPPNSEELELNRTFVFHRGVELLWCESKNGEANLREGLAAYYSLISLIDQEVGRILEALDERGLRDDTVVVFCADHGDYAGEYSRMAKGWNYDAIHRVPMIWRWPGHMTTGHVYNELVETIDFFPTVCRLADVPIPVSVQGQDLAAILAGASAPLRDAVFYEFIGVKTVRTKTHKLSYGYDGQHEIGELFDLVADPHEYVNLFERDGEAGTREKLLRRLLNWQIETQQPRNIPVGNENLPPSRWFNDHRAVVEHRS